MLHSFRFQFVLLTNSFWNFLCQSVTIWQNTLMYMNVKTNFEYVFCMQYCYRYFFVRKFCKCISGIIIWLLFSFFELTDCLPLFPFFYYYSAYLSYIKIFSYFLNIFQLFYHINIFQAFRLFHHVLSLFDFFKTFRCFHYIWTFLLNFSRNFDFSSYFDISTKVDFLVLIHFANISRINN